VGADKIDVVPFWLDGRKIRPGNRDNPWRREQGIAPDTFVALYQKAITGFLPYSLPFWPGLMTL
jgi:hypothetical protein